MSEMTELGSTLASKLRVNDGMERARRALDVARAGFGGQLRSLTDVAASAKTRPAIPVDSFRGASGHIGAETAAWLSNLGPLPSPRAGLGSATGLGIWSTVPLGTGAGRTGATEITARARLTMLDASSGARVRPGVITGDNKSGLTATPNFVPRYIARAIKAEALATKSGATLGWGAPPGGQATNAAIRSSDSSGLENSPTYGTAARGGNFTERPATRGVQDGGNARARPTTSAPIAMSPVQRGTFVLPDDQGVQIGDASGSGSRGLQSGAPSSATSASVSQATNSGPTGGDVYLDGALMGRWMARNLTAQANRPASGGAGFDPRRGVFPTGAMIGG